MARGIGTTRNRWSRTAVVMCGASGLVALGAGPGDAAVPAAELAAEAVVPSVYFDQRDAVVVGIEPVASADLDRVAVGQEYREPPTKVFTRTVFSWSQLGVDIAAGPPEAMSGDGTRVAVGIYDANRLRIFDTDSDSWSQLGADIDVGVAAGRLGWSVAMSASGDQVAVGAPEGSSGAGYVRVFEWDGTAWTRLGADLGGGTAGVGFGWSVAMSADGDRVAISERPRFTGEMGDRIVEGMTRVFDWDGAGWSQVGVDIAAVGDDLALSGSGDRLAVGVCGDWYDGTFGRVWILDLVGGGWATVDYSEGQPANSVALSADGRRLAYSGIQCNAAIDADPGQTVVRDERAEGWVDVGVVRGELWNSSDRWVALAADGNRMAIGGSSYVRVLDILATPPPPLASPIALEFPARLLDSRVGAETMDGLAAGIGVRPARSVTEVPVIRRGGVPGAASAVMLDVVAVRPEAGGYLTVYPCDTPRPLASNLNYAAGQTIANAVFTGLGAEGTVCVYTSASTELVIDVTGYTPPARSGLHTLYPDRLMDTRDGIVVTGYEDVDEVDRLPAGSVTALYVTGWPNAVPRAASALMLDVIAVRPEANGYLTVYPCGSPRPLASSLNYAAGQTIAKTVFARVGGGGRVCFYTSATTDVVVDVTGYTPDESGLASVVPGRLLDSRVAAETVDGVSAGIGRRPAGSLTELLVAGRYGMPADVSAVILDVVAVRPDAGGYLTVYPCGTPRPLVSNLNYAAGQTIANAVFTRVAANGTVCIYTSAGTDLVVDVSGHT